MSLQLLYGLLFCKHFLKHLSLCNNFIHLLGKFLVNDKNSYPLTYFPVLGSKPDPIIYIY